MWPEECRECIGNTMCMYKGISKFHVKLLILNAIIGYRLNLSFGCQMNCGQCSNE